MSYTKVLLKRFLKRYNKTKSNFYTIDDIELRDIIENRVKAIRSMHWRNVFQIR